MALWALLWLSAPAVGVSAIKTSFPKMPEVEAMRSRFLALIGDEPDDALALVAGLAIGERSLLSEQTAEQMRDLSLTHLVAVSGANLAIVIGAVWFLAAYLGFSRGLRFILGLTAMSCYVLLVGPESSVIRAATMAFFVTVGLWLGRGSSPLHSLALAVSVLLVLDPAIATDFGFSLSAIATAGLLVAAGPLFETLRTRLPDWLALGVSAAVAAQLFTTPILLMLQPGLPLYAVFANLLVEPVVAPVTILGISSAALAIPLPSIAQLGIFLASIGTGWIVEVAKALSGLPLVRLHFVGGPLGVAIAAASVVSIAGYFQASGIKTKRWLLRLTGGLFALGGILSLVDIARSGATHRDWEVLNCDVGQGDAMLIRNSGFVALIDVGPEAESIRSCLGAAGVERIDLLVISHYDADHVAGIDGLEEVSVGLAILPGFADDRPLADKVELRMESWAERIETGQRGMTGSLGKCLWRILEPSYSAAETTDSNDASLVTLFECPELRVLALGDLGEPGQSRLLASSESYMRGTAPLVLKVAHHGSADQSRRLHEAIRPAIAVLSVGENRFGHPTERVLRILTSVGAQIFRTDQNGAVSIASFEGRLTVMTGGKLAS